MLGVYTWSVVFQPRRQCDCHRECEEEDGVRKDEEQLSAGRLYRG